MNIQELKNKIDDYVKNGSIVFGISIHGVGFELRIRDINIEEIIGNQYFICGKRVNKETYTKLNDYMHDIYVKQGKQSKDRGLY